MNGLGDRLNMSVDRSVEGLNHFELQSNRFPGD